MNNRKQIRGFSKLNRTEKLALIEARLKNPASFTKVMNEHLHPDNSLQKIYDEFSENTLSNYYLPYGVAPNFLVNGINYIVPMVTEESSVVAAAASAAGFWFNNGGISTRIIGTEKTGQVHFIWKGKREKLFEFFKNNKETLILGVDLLTEKMRARGGGITGMDLIDKTKHIEGYYQLDTRFETKDAMGANFINSCLEQLAEVLKDEISRYPGFSDAEKEAEVIMSILSNYTPGCMVEARVECPVDNLELVSQQYSAGEFARRFQLAVRMAEVDINRAVTHNKGIFNGIDAIALATGNDFRALEACGHAFASESGRYKGLSSVEISDDVFQFVLKVPMALGTIGGLTHLHPIAAQSLELLGNPSAEILMQIAVAVGLANNFSAVRSLVTSGIQHGHMKMHLKNILNHFKATEEEKEKAHIFFQDKPVSFREVEQFLNKIR